MFSPVGPHPHPTPLGSSSKASTSPPLPGDRAGPLVVSGTGHLDDLLWDVGDGEAIEAHALREDTGQDPAVQLEGDLPHQPLPGHLPRLWGQQGWGVLSGQAGASGETLALVLNLLTDLGGCRGACCSFGGPASVPAP